MRVFTKLLVFNTYPFDKCQLILLHNNSFYICCMLWIIELQVLLVWYIILLKILFLWTDLDSLLKKNPFEWYIYIFRCIYIFFLYFCNFFHVLKLRFFFTLYMLIWSVNFSKFYFFAMENPRTNCTHFPQKCHNMYVDNLWFDVDMYTLSVDMYTLSTKMPWLSMEIHGFSMDMINCPWQIYTRV